MKKLFLAVVIGSVALSGCTIRVADMTVASSKNYNINAGKFTKGVRVIGEDRYPVVIIPFGLPNIKTAMDNAIQKDRCAVGLSDVVMSQLSVLLAQPVTCGPASVPATTATGSMVYGTQRAELDRAHAQRIIGISAEGDEGLIALAGCQGYVRELMGTE